MAVKEKTVVQSIERAIRSRYPGAWLLKVHGGPMQRVGIPDLLVVVEGHLYAFEVKAQRDGESEEHARSRASAHQVAELADIARAGATSAVVLSAEEALRYIET